ncbi:MAG: type II toxin-antitoxin system ParD family antitoxin [Candidatus Hadarchaeales archaeon]
MTKGKKLPQPPPETGIEYRATIRFPRKDYEFMQKMIEEGEYTNMTEIVREAVKRLRKEMEEAMMMEKYFCALPFGLRRMVWRRHMKLPREEAEQK